MLTKEHLRYSVRTGRVRPTLLPSDDATALALAGDMIALLADAEGMQVGELEEALEALGGEGVGAAFRKLLLNACTAEADDGTVEEQRWRALQVSQAVRTGGARLDLAAFNQELTARLGRPADGVREGLYADLPACRRIAAVPAFTSDSLIHRYNLAQVQGLLLRSRQVLVSVGAADLAERRALFRQLRFHRLMGEVSETKGRLTVVLSGPLSIFDQAATYGLRLATFFPHIVHLKDWALDAEVHINKRGAKRELTLHVDQSSGLVSHYRQQKPYIPPELLAFIDAFNARTSEWQAKAGGDFVHLGRESYCFPDLTITRHDGRAFHVELFHRWHAKQLGHRLQVLENSEVSNLFLGVAKNLARTPDGAVLESSSWFSKRGFIFTEFPTPKALLTLLATYGKV